MGGGRTWSLRCRPTQTDCKGREIPHGRLLAVGDGVGAGQNQLAHGQWTGFLKKWKIDKARASRACAIHRTFEDVAATSGLSVEQAYARRKRKLSPTNTNRKDGKPTAAKGSFLDIIKQVCNRAEHFVDEAAVAGTDDIKKLLDPVAEAICRLTEIQAWLKGQAEAK